MQLAQKYKGKETEHLLNEQPPTYILYSSVYIIIYNKSELDKYAQKVNKKYNRLYILEYLN